MSEENSNEDQDSNLVSFLLRGDSGVGKVNYYNETFFFSHIFIYSNEK